VLTDNLDELHRLATSLLEYETLTGEEAKRAIKGDDIGRDNPSAKPTSLPVSGASIPSTRRPKGGIGGPAAQGAINSGGSLRTSSRGAKRRGDPDCTGLRAPRGSQ